MPELSRFLVTLAVTGALAACAGTDAEAPADGAGGSPSRDATAAPPSGDGTEGGDDGALAQSSAGASSQDLDDLDPQTRRRVELWQQMMQQIEPCLRPRLAEIEDVDDAGVVAVQVEYDDAGAPLSADLQEGAQQRMQENATYRAVVNAVLNSVRECAPLTEMPQEEFDTWRLFPVVIRPRAA
ncbi:MAG: hypothetical protein ACLFTG_06165 [Alphaproteobacteria bacterium]